MKPLFMLIFINTFVSIVQPPNIYFYTFGDSHSHWHPNILEDIPFSYALKTHSMYGKTMYGATRLGIKVINFKKFKIEPNSIVMFNFGEVDSRNHLYKFHETGLSKEIKRLVKRYESLILQNLELVPTVHIWIGGLVPTKRNPTNEHRGNNQDRLLYNRMLNDELVRMAKRNSFFFLDNYSDYADDHGFLRIDLSDNHIHIGREKFTDNTKEAIAKEVERIMLENMYSY